MLSLICQERRLGLGTMEEKEVITESWSDQEHGIMVEAVISGDVPTWVSMWSIRENTLCG